MKFPDMIHQDTDTALLSVGGVEMLSVRDPGPGPGPLWLRPPPRQANQNISCR